MKPTVISATLGLLFIAGTANALSCLRPDPVRLYVQARDSDQAYAIVTGRLDADARIAVPAVPQDGSPPKDRAAVSRVRMTGLVLGTEAFDQSFDREIDVAVTCLSVWCGDPPVGQDIVAALRLGGQVPELEIGPCGGMAVMADKAGLQRLLECHRSGECGM